jgi:TRAP-type C4-dicarboxylate transport system substrate-binding protein
MMAGGRALLEMYNKFPQLRAEYKGIKLFGNHQMNPYILVSKKKEVTLPEHFKGMKVGGNGYSLDLVKNSGGADVNQVPPDAYMNMDKGVVDASFLNWTQVGLYKIYEAAKYYYEYPFGAGAFVMVMNEDFWNGMSREDQKIFTDLWDEQYEMGAKNQQVASDKGRNATIADGRCRIRKATPQEDAAWKKAAAPILADWLKMSKSQGAKDPEAVLAEWKRVTEAYQE